MHTKNTLKQSVKKQDVIYISVLLIITSVIGIYLIGTTVAIAKDGVTFIEYAKNLEIASTKTMIQQDQHPGYPIMISYAHKITKLLSGNDSIYSWIQSAQSTSLIFRLLTVVMLYFVGINLVTNKFAFWAILILILLPEPAKYGSDALSDWPHLFFLALGLFLLLDGARNRKLWLFGFVGISAGLGYLIRPECAQLVIYGTLWLTFQLFWPKRTISRVQAVFALVLLVCGFGLLAGPYMHLKGAIFPKKNVGHFAVNAQLNETCQSPPQTFPRALCTAAITPPDIAKAAGKLFQNISETLMWFFIPALLIGLFKSFRKMHWNAPDHFLIIILVALNVLLMVWLYCGYGYISGRHTLPLMAFTIFYIPEGLETLASWLAGRSRKETNQTGLKEETERFWFAILVVIGIAICIPKLLKPLHYDKLIFRKAAQWLAENARDNDLLAVPDLRISFYAGRKGVDYVHQPLKENVQYVVRVYKEKEITASSENLPQVGSVLYTDKSDNKLRLDIYKPLN